MGCDFFPWQSYVQTKLGYFKFRHSNTDYYEQKHYHSAIAAALHVGEAVQAFFLASLQYNLNPLVVLLWTLNVFFFGIFGFWPLAFPQVTMLMIKDSRLKKDSI